MGDVIYISALVVKNWRLYRIFNNRGMKIIVSDPRSIIMHIP